MYTKILFATDLNSEHAHLTEKAVSIAKQFKATLHLLHVIELPASVQLAQGLGFTELASPSTEDAQTVLSLMSDNYKIPAKQQHVDIGSVKACIFEKAKELNCELIILGSHTENSIPSLLGSTAHAVVNHAPCDVLILKAQ